MSKDIRNEVYIGYNGTGKTKKLEEILKEIRPKKEENVIYIPAEQNFKNELEKEKSTAGGNFIYLIKKLIYEIFGENNFIYEAKKEEIEKIENRSQYKEKINNFFNNLKDDDDFIIKSENFFNDEIKFNTLKFNLAAYESPSGKNNYSLIKILGSLFKYAKDNNIKINDFEDFYIIIDEPEKFSHPNLIKKIAIFLKEISNKVNIILTTHSPLFLSYFLDEDRTKIYYMDEKFESNLGKSINEILDEINKINNIQKTSIHNNILLNRAHRIDFFTIIFSKKIILVEDISTKFLINYILEEKNLLTEYEIFICHGVTNIKGFELLLIQFGLKKDYIKIIMDLDGEEYGKKDILKKFSPEQILYTFKNNLEEDILTEKSDLKEKGLNKKSNALGIIKNIDDIKKTKIYKNIEKKIE